MVGHLFADYSWDQNKTSLALKKEGATVWRFNAGAEDSKPCFHPLTLPDGSVITDFRPGDHRWHRGAWFSWKFLNERNFWEEDKHGTSPGGSSRIEHVRFDLKPDFSAVIELSMCYQDTNGVNLFSERRIIAVSPPDASGGYSITTEMECEALSDVTINQYYYGGFSLRMSKGHEAWIFLDAHGTTGRTHVKKDKQHRLTRAPSPWAAFVDSPEGPNQGVAILGHAENLRHPSRWLLLPHMPFMGPVFQYGEYVVLKEGERLSLKYKLLIFKDKQATAFLNEAQKTFNRYSSTIPPLTGSQRAGSNIEERELSKH
jgi:hypothetical protein